MMQPNDTTTVGKAKHQIPSHDPINDADDEASGIEATKDAHSPNDTDPVQPQRISREAAENGIAPDADPDDPVSA